VANLIVRESPVDGWVWEENFSWNSNNKTPGEWHMAKEIETPKNLLSIDSCTMSMQWKGDPAGTCKISLSRSNPKMLQGLIEGAGIGQEVDSV